ncbi:MAG: HNH endonuclease [Clostridia bacterium]|nr:HNH endonuclease [Clostridia bacterium]
MYEIAIHGVDPREKLEGTTMRIRRNEGYKFNVIVSWQEQVKAVQQGKLSYVDALLQALSGVNLVHYRQRNSIKEKLDTRGSEMFEDALRDLFEGNEDSVAFEEIVSAIGGNYDVLGFLFFLKDPNQYMPIRSDMFEERLRLLGIDAHLSHNCTWKSYQQYNGWIKEIYQYLQKYMNSSVQLIDAHSFLWVVPGLSKYIDSDLQMVEHNKFGKGIVVGFDRDLIKVKFGKETRSFEKQDCFDRGILRLIPAKISIYDEDENEIIVEPEREPEETVIPEPKKQIQRLDKDTIEVNDELDNQLIHDLDMKTDDVQESDSSIASYMGIIKPRPEPVERKGRSVYSRNPMVAGKALTLARHKCEISVDHPTFIRRNNGKPYTEPHHLVPMAYQDLFEVSLDREENIVSLCSNCHNEIHYGKDALKLVEALYTARKDLLKSVGIDITLSELQQMYC